MKKGYTERILSGKKHHTIVAGECFVATGDYVICTVLGSCISVCLYADDLSYCGMNHFMLPCRNERYRNAEDILYTNSGYYGINAMELLINELMKRGVDKRKLVAKVFGGANVLPVMSGSKTVGEQNIEFTMRFLKIEKIPIAACSTGGNFARKILFFAQSGEVHQYRLGSGKVRRILYDEEGLLRKTE